MSHKDTCYTNPTQKSTRLKLKTNCQ